MSGEPLCHTTPHHTTLSSTAQNLRPPKEVFVCVLSHLPLPMKRSPPGLCPSRARHFLSAQRPAPSPHAEETSMPSVESLPISCFCFKSSKPPRSPSSTALSPALPSQCAPPWKLQAHPTAQHQGPDPPPRPLDGSQNRNLDLTQGICSPLVYSPCWCVCGGSTAPLPWPPLQDPWAKL